jgi:hypothetical protein
MTYTLHRPRQASFETREVGLEQFSASLTICLTFLRVSVDIQIPDSVLLLRLSEVAVHLVTLRSVSFTCSASPLLVPDKWPAANRRLAVLPFINFVPVASHLVPLYSLHEHLKPLVANNLVVRKHEPGRRR